MKSLIWLVALFAAAVAVTLISHNTGYLLLVFPPYRIEMSLPMFIFGLVGIFSISYLIVRFISTAIHLPQQVRTFRAERAQSKGRAAMTEALTAFFEGRYAAAEKAAVRAMELGEHSGLNSIIAARAANALHEFEKRDAYLSEAQGKSVGEETMRLMAQAEFHLDHKQPQSALSSLKELSETGLRKHIGALNLELKAQQQARNWDAVLDVANQLEKRNAINKTLSIQMRQQAWIEKLRSSAHDSALLRGTWKSMPTPLKQRNKVAAEAARAFIQLGESSAARNLLADSLNDHWDSELASLYGDCHAGSVTGQIEQAERWLQQHHDDAGLLLALGKLCLHQELWGKAQNYLDASLSVQPSREAYLTLAKLAEKLGKTDDATRHYQMAAQLSAMQ
ncbi:MAG: heme biosynthesis HemY N-terminal domain-containing protein [Sideroxydans sp.]|nr:heme biosynthesis HemY N-terminal domain-containing protein [Sideroxydans sp.]